MLILTRKPGEGIDIGDDISIRVISQNGSQISIGIDAPKDVAINREEITRRIQEQQDRSSGA